MSISSQHPEHLGDDGCSALQRRLGGAPTAPTTYGDACTEWESPQEPSQIGPLFPLVRSGNSGFLEETNQRRGECLFSCWDFNQT